MIQQGAFHVVAARKPTHSFMLPTLTITTISINKFIMFPATLTVLIRLPYANTCVALFTQSILIYIIIHSIIKN